MSAAERLCDSSTHHLGCACWERTRTAIEDQLRADVERARQHARAECIREVREHAERLRRMGLSLAAGQAEDAARMLERTI